MSRVVILGAGPAGLTLACRLAQAGVEHLVVERSHHPRTRVGESLLPMALGVFQEIGFLDVMREAGFPVARGIVYHGDDDDDPVVVGYDEFPGGLADGRGTVHAERSRLDLLLLKHAESLGCRIVQGAAARQVLFEGDRAVGVRIDVGYEPVEVRARVVVDATGHQTLLGSQLGIRTRDPELDQIALHTWMRDVDHGPDETASHTHLCFLPVHRGWAWLTPLGDGLTSVGLVADRTDFQAHGGEPARFFADCTKECPELVRRLGNARPVRRLQAEASVNYALERICGDGWLAVGDAARFVDPVFSSGVGVAVQSARTAADVLLGALKDGDATEAALRPYQDQLFRAASVWREFVRLFYRLMPAFTVFLRSRAHRPGLLRLLQGDVSDPAVREVLDDMRALVAEVEASTGHPLHGALRRTLPEAP